MDRHFEVIFDGDVIGRVSTETPEQGVPHEALERCIVKIGLLGCLSSDSGRRCPSSNGLHAHIPLCIFDFMRPVERGGRKFFLANLPGVGEVSYNFDSAHGVPPPITFREVTGD